MTRRLIKKPSVHRSARALQPLALVALVGVVGTVSLLGGCGGGGGGSKPDPTPTAEPTQVPTTPTPTPTGSAGPTPTPTPTGSTGPTPTPTASPTPGPTPTPVPTPTPTPTPPANSLKLDAELSRIQAIGGSVVSVVALAPDDRWLIAYDDTILDNTDGTKFSYPSDAPVTLRNKLAEIRANGGKVRAAALGTGDSWVVIFNEASSGYTQFEYNNISATLINRLTTLYNARQYNITSVTFGADTNTWVITVSQNGFYTNGNVPSGLTQQLTNFASSGGVTVSQAVIGANNSWAVIYNNNKIVAGGIDSGLFDFVNTTTGSIQANNYTVNTLALGQFTRSFALVYRGNVPYVGTLTRAR